MKKISILLMLMLLVFSMTSCQLAEEDTNTHEDQNTIETGPYLPIIFNYEVYDSDGRVDVSEYFHYSWFTSKDFTDEILSIETNIGKSMEVVKSHTAINVVELGDGVSSKETVETFEVNAFFGNQSHFTALYPVVTYMNYEGETFVENEVGMGIQRGVSVTSKHEVTNFNGENWTIIYRINFIIIDELQSVEVREFDESDNLIKTTVIAEETILDELALDSNTDYYFIVETYKDMNDDLYTERYYFESNEINYHKYKFLNEDGFVYLDNLHVYKSE